MAKKVRAVVRIQLQAGKATPAPPVGPALGQHAINIMAFVKEYNEKHYHQPSDEYRPEMDFSGDALMAKFGIALGWRAATQQQEIEWQPGDEFEKARKASE